MAGIRPYAPADREALFDICVQTANVGADATGIASDDQLWGLLFAVPYAERHPDLCWIVDDGDGRAIGYIVATDDTDAFYHWFHDEWWPLFASRFPRPAKVASRESELLDEAYQRGLDENPHAEEYPAHLHINLLAGAQGKGLGRSLIETLFSELARRGVIGVHLMIDPTNAGAAAFYQRLGMHVLPSDPDGNSYGMKLIASASAP